MVDLGPLYDDPHPGYIFLVPMPGWGGKVIKWGQFLAGDGWTKIQHAGVFVGEVDGWDGPRTIEAYPGGAIVGRMDRYDPSTIVWLRCPPAYRDAVTGAALAFKDVPYSFLDYAALDAHRFHVPVPHLEEFISDQGHVICSQLSDAAAGNGGWHIFDDERWPGFVTPNDLGKAAKLQPPGGYVERVKVSR